MNLPSNIDTPINDLAIKLGNNLMQSNKKIVFAESLTSGLLAATAANIPKASNWLWGGFVTYNTLSKNILLGVDENLLNTIGPVCHECAKQMALGALKKSNNQAQIAISLTGVAGPGPDSFNNPQGRVYIGIASDNILQSFEINLTGDRKTIREKSVAYGLYLAIQWCESI